MSPTTVTGEEIVKIFGYISALLSKILILFSIVKMR